MKIPARSVRILLGVGVSLIGPLAYGYSAGNHVIITKHAVEEFNFCSQALGLTKLPKGAAKILSRANIYEDINIFIKSWNWHLYHPTKNLGGGLGLGHSSLKHRFQVLEKRVHRRPS